MRRLGFLACLFMVWGLALTAAAVDAVRLRIIVVDSREEAMRLREQLLSGADFAALAKERSQDPAGREGGYLGLVRVAGLRPELQDVLRGVEPGQVSRVAELATGFAILKVLKDDEVVDGPGLSVSENFQLSDRANVREPPTTSGLAEVESTFQKLPRDDGWNRDMAEVCRRHDATVQGLVDKVGALVDPRRSGSMPALTRLQHRYSAGLLASYQGRTADAITFWEQALAVARTGAPAAVPMMLEILGTAHLHKAAMDNGVYSRPGVRCLFPPEPGGPSPKLDETAHSEKAVQYFTDYLKNKPRDLEVQWLLNLAYMQLGKYPDGLPPAHLVPPSLFACSEPFIRFEDHAPAAGLKWVLTSGGIVVDDFDNDGLLDIVTASYEACQRILYYHNDGNGTFSDRSQASGVAAVAGSANLTQADFNNDGCMDLLVLRGGWQLPLPLSLLRNNCDGTFTDIAQPAGLADMVFATQTGVFTDVDNDGWLDIFVGNEQGGPCQLYRNKKDGTFENISKRAGVEATGFVKSVASTDYDNDGYPDLYVSNFRGGDNRLYRNNRDLTFTEIAPRAGVAQSWRSFPTWFFDYDNDGWPDLFVASDYASVEETMRTYQGLPRTAGPLKLYRNAGDGTFTDVTESVGLDKVFMPMGANFGDADGDGWLDIYLGTGAPEYGALAPNVLLRNKEGKIFVDVTACSGTGELHKTHGVAFADFENDGTQDILAEIGGAVPGDAHAPRLFRNPGNGNRWIGVKLVGVKSNRAGLGARIAVTVEGEGGQTRTIRRTVDTGGSWGASPLAQNIGLGRASKITKLEVWWPTSQTRQTFAKVPLDQWIEVREDAASFAKLKRPIVRLARGTSPR